MPVRADGDAKTVTFVLDTRQAERIRALAQLRQLPDERRPNYSRAMREVVTHGLAVLFPAPTGGRSGASEESPS